MLGSLGIEIERFAPSHRTQQPSQSESVAREQQPPTPRLAVVRSAVMIEMRKIH
jgi:hypothetical protein